MTIEVCEVKGKIYKVLNDTYYSERTPKELEIDKWFGSYKVRSFPWIDGKRIYFNVQYFASGQSISKPPIWDKTVYIVDNTAGQRLVSDFTNSLVNHIAHMQMEKGSEVTFSL